MIGPLLDATDNNYLILELILSGFGIISIILGIYIIILDKREYNGILWDRRNYKVDDDYKKMEDEID